MKCPCCSLERSEVKVGTLFVLSQSVQLCRSQVTTRNEETGQIKTGEKETLAATSTEHIIRNSSQADRKTSRKTKKKML
jgi:hypothetical protein